MYKAKRLCVAVTPMEKTVVERLAKAEGELSSSALIRRIIRNAARERDIWPPNKHQPMGHRNREVQHG